ncbi:restriction endonuclease subunit S [Gulosibacter sediminis]|uniref:restriction endonuclease subunit S n=1 Tax=Gulosibacter sediminis TaxID=1729695 RepID=UPI0024A96DB9|nr:restriction endonuclease subunit S [Gulosibacter sediminis]
METKTLAEIGTVVTGKTPSTSRRDYYGGDIPFVTPNELHAGRTVGQSAKTLSEAGLQSIKGSILEGTSVLVGCIGWDMGNVAMTNDRCASNQQINAVTSIISEVNPEYLYYWLSTKKDYLFSIASVTRTPILSKSTFEQVKVPLPSRNVQDGIARILASIDDQITTNDQVNDNLQTMLQTLYGYWFLQFDFPDENSRPYRSSGGRMVWSDQLKREIPEGWGVASLVSNPLCEPLKPGVAPFSEKTYLATADVVGTTIKSGSRIRYETREGRANMEPVLNSVWFAKMKGSVKHLFLNEACASLISETILSTGFVGLKCDPSAFEYIASFIASEQFEPLKDLHAHGATQQAVNSTDLENVLLPVPDALTLRGFSQLASSTLGRFNASIIENKRLQELRDWLLPMLMNGQATVASSDKLSFT